jgi:hypothetical protein
MTAGHQPPFQTSLNLHMAILNLSILQGGLSYFNLAATPYNLGTGNFKSLSSTGLLPDCYSRVITIETSHTQPAAKHIYDITIRQNKAVMTTASLCNVLSIQD